jgi:phthalate 4,5-cis-dihydrodiol dehydrogenase
VRFGFIGLGNAGTTLTGALARHPGYRIVAAARRNVAALRQFRVDFDAQVFGSVEELCECPEVDAVYVATPNHLHAAHVLIAAEHGKHLIVEKPMALSLADADAIISAADRNGVPAGWPHVQLRPRGAQDS